MSYFLRPLSFRYTLSLSINSRLASLLNFMISLITNEELRQVLKEYLDGDYMKRYIIASLMLNCSDHDKFLVIEIEAEHSWREN